MDLMSTWISEACDLGGYIHARGEAINLEIVGAEWLMDEFVAWLIAYSWISPHSAAKEWTAPIVQRKALDEFTFLIADHSTLGSLRLPAQKTVMLQWAKEDPVNDEIFVYTSRFKRIATPSLLRSAASNIAVPLASAGGNMGALWQFHGETTSNSQLLTSSFASTTLLSAIGGLMFDTLSKKWDQKQAKLAPFSEGNVPPPRERSTSTPTPTATASLWSNIRNVVAVPAMFSQRILRCTPSSVEASSPAPAQAQPLDLPPPPYSPRAERLSTGASASIVSSVLLTAQQRRESLQRKKEEATALAQEKERTRRAIIVTWEREVVQERIANKRIAAQARIAKERAASDREKLAAQRASDREKMASDREGRRVTLIATLMAQGIPNAQIKEALEFFEI
ncbi:hypothetical protein BDK51DRAFT_52643 [Blyttiomyces helicus]|uniref:Uncharacterized protein n=1 Tax=Blyttiomyces helicus TaxID=388810 RepID=A0A4P9VWI5_9FUNG|nr:hypothetical protein BDK51DRAFT_52643 [Blyttiomyces helicus]|eukprot:RKO83215.1 hypothetical protein BDK51DRAFT_52643 [Blyttiomyces helicus]